MLSGPCVAGDREGLDRSIVHDEPLIPATRIRIHHLHALISTVERFGGTVAPSGHRSTAFRIFPRRRKPPNLHDRLATPRCHDNTPFTLEGDPPDRLGRLTQLPYQTTSCQIPDLDSTVRTTRNNARVVELEAGDAVVVGCKAVDWGVSFERPNADGAVGATGHERGGAHLELADKGGMALEDGLARSN